MNEYIVYTTEGYTSGPNTNINIENCQVLGTIYGQSETDAVNNLFQQNEWIENAGFTIDNAFARPLLTSPIKEDIKTIIDYLWTDEQTHFQENHYPEDHIFRILMSLRNTL